MEILLYQFTLIIAVLDVSRSATTVSSTVSTSSTIQESDETTTNREFMYTSTSSDASISTTVDINTTIADFTNHPSNVTISETTTTESDTTIADSTTSTTASVTTVDEFTIINDFTTSVNTDSSTTDLETTTAYELTSTDSSTQFTDLTTSVPSETTTTVSISSTTASELSTTLEQDTTPVTSTELYTTTSISEEETTARNANVTVGYLCQTTEIFAEDDVRNYVIIALSIALGIQSISVIIWCVISRVFVNVKKTSASTETQTDFFISREIYVRPLPPINTFMKKDKPSISVNRSMCFTDKHPSDIRVDIIPEQQPVDTKIDIYFDKAECSEDNIQQRKYYKKYDDISSKINSVPTGKSCRLNEDTQSVLSSYTDVSSDDIYKTPVEELISGDSGYLYPDKEYADSMASESELLLLGSETDSSSFDPIQDEREIDLGGEKIFAHITNMSGLDEASTEPTRSKAKMLSVSLENKKRSFQPKRYTDNIEDVEDIITLDTDTITPTERHVSFKEPIDHTITCQTNRKEAWQSEHVVTLTSPRYRKLVSRKTHENTRKANTMKPNVVKKVDKKKDFGQAIPSSQPRDRYRATYDIISSAFFKPDITEYKMMEHLRQLEKRKMLRLKANRRNKKIKTQSKLEPKFLSEPYHSLYSRLSHFENE